MINNLDLTSLAKIKVRKSEVKPPTTCSTCLYGIRYPGYCENMGGICGCGKLVGTRMIRERK